ncbi:MAG: VWA domain-containing protein, partial [Burkholderiales bacterium]|nr:VWA domain-containing protein [Anaerolineae bacterium]
MKRSLLFLIALLIIVAIGMPVGLVAMQDSAAPRIEITGINPSQLPEVTVTANVYNALGQPVRGLTAADFSVEGELAGQVSIVKVENVTDNDLSFAVVLLIDTSDSMAGTPLIRAKEAATAFVENVGPNDPVAIMSFDRNVELVQNYTTDTAALLAAIASLETGGPTSLYQGTFEAIRVAQSAPTPRRVVVLLSDGAEFGGWSTVERDAALEEAQARGVSVVTIGLGYGTDRTYLQELALGTNSRNVESPTPEELLGIYTDLAALLRSQYVITLDAQLPADGTEYDLTLRVDTPDGSATAAGSLRAPIPVPIIRFGDIPVEPIDVPTDIEVTIMADDELVSSSTTIAGAVLSGSGSITAGAAVEEEEPDETVTETFAVTIDPVQYPPGPYTLTISATDEDGDIGTESVEFEIGAVPSAVEIVPDVADLGVIAEPQTLTLAITGQTPPTSASFQIDDQPALVVETQPFLF